jgi:hypothetical protein
MRDAMGLKEAVRGCRAGRPPGFDRSSSRRRGTGEPVCAPEYNIPNTMDVWDQRTWLISAQGVPRRAGLKEALFPNHQRKKTSKNSKTLHLCARLCSGQRRRALRCCCRATPSPAGGTRRPPTAAATQRLLPRPLRGALGVAPPRPPPGLLCVTDRRKGSAFRLCRAVPALGLMVDRCVESGRQTRRGQRVDVSGGHSQQEKKAKGISKSWPNGVQIRGAAGTQLGES